MTDIGEAVAAFDEATENEVENYCDKKKSESTSWKARIDGFGGEKPSAAKLLSNMKAQKKKLKEKYSGKIPDKALIKKIDGKWNLDSCNTNQFPFQTHHLIPKKYLPEHMVCVWLTKDYEDHPIYQLIADTNYDTDNANNGYCMPFVSTTYQWAIADGNEAAEVKVAQDMMRKTGIQLHQGSHSKTNFGEEVEDIESEGYLIETEKMLNLVSARAEEHIVNCKICCKDGSGKPNTQPLEKVVSHMDMVSNILKLKIDANNIFVSERAYDAFIASRKKVST